MKTTSIVSALFVLFTLVSCSNKEKELQKVLDANIKTYKDSKNPAEKNELRTKIFVEIDSLVKTYPNNEKIATYLYSGSEMAFESSDLEKANSYLSVIYSKYTSYEKIADATLKLAIIADTKGEVENAKKYYSEFIEKYPTHKDLNIAKDALSIVGKDIDELIKQFESKADSIATK